jgi:hypothetical protein
MWITLNEMESLPYQGHDQAHGKCADKEVYIMPYVLNSTSYCLCERSSNLSMVNIAEFNLSHLT